MNIITKHPMDGMPYSKAEAPGVSSQSSPLSKPISDAFQSHSETNPQFASKTKIQQLKERIDLLTHIDPNASLPAKTKSSSILQLFKSGISNLWTTLNDKPRVQKTSKEKHSSFEECAHQIALDPQIDFDDPILKKCLEELNFNLKKTLLKKALECKNLKLIKKCRQIIDNDPSPCEPSTKQALRRAILENSIKAIEELAASGANLDITIDCVSPLDLAISNFCKLETIQALIIAGANVNNPSIYFPLERAIMMQRWDVVKLLIETGAGFGYRSSFSSNSSFALRFLLSHFSEKDSILHGLNAIYGNDWKKDNNLLLILLLEKPDFISLIDSHLINKEFFIEILSNCDPSEKDNYLRFLPENLLYSRDFWLDAVIKKKEISQILPQDQQNRDFWISALIKNNEVTSVLPLKFFESHDFWTEALVKSLEVNQVERSKNLLPPKFYESTDFWVKAIARNSEVLKVVPKNFLDEFQTDFSNPRSSAIKIQRAFRRWQLRKKIKNIPPEKIESQRKKQHLAPIPKAVREPLEDLTKHTDWILDSNPNLAAAQRAITQAAKFGSYDKFKIALRASFSDTLQSIYSSPPNEREYVIIADIEGKSTNWAISHLHDLMSAHPPKEIIFKDSLWSFLNQNPHVKHIVMVDDGAYSGEQASRYISQIKNLQPHHKFHVAIPYMTAYGKERIAKALQQKKCDYQMHDRQVMFSYRELVDNLKIFALTGRVIINNALISKIPDLSNQENSPIRMDINKKLEELRTLASKNVNEQEVYEKILETITFIDSHRAALGNKGIELMHQLFGTIKPEYDQRRHGELLSAYLGHLNVGAYAWSIVTEMYGDKTASWFAHKGADSISCNISEMKLIAGNLEPVEPYKDGTYTLTNRQKQVENIKKSMGNHTIEETVTNQKDHAWLKDRIDFVQTNRGFYLLGNSYLVVNSYLETTHPHLILHINGKMIKLGGKEGEYQYKLKKGDLFVLEDPDTHRKATLKLNDAGKLQPVG